MKISIAGGETATHLTKKPRHAYNKAGIWRAENVLSPANRSLINTEGVNTYEMQAL